MVFIGLGFANFWCDLLFLGLSSVLKGLLFFFFCCVVSRVLVAANLRNPSWAGL